MDQASKAARYLLPYRKKLLFLLSIVLGSGSLVYLVLYVDPRLYNGKVYWIRQYTEKDSVNISMANDSNIFLTDDLIIKMGKSIKELKPCTPHPLLNSNKTHIWIEKDNLPHYSVINSLEHIACCYRSFYRPKWIDDITSLKIDRRIKYNNCRNFNSSIKILVKDEFVRVNCSCNTKTLFDSFFLFAREKKVVTKLTKGMEYNILILGIDAVSRLNLHRTMPKTVQFLRKLGAVEFLRYNKVGENTFPNLIPLLLGKNMTELRETCWPHNRLTFDNCPFLWEWFQQAGFVTALGEDSARLGTFNYNKRGFAGTPTNYYLYTFMSEAETVAGNKEDKQLKICMNDKYFYKILLDYVKDLTAMTKNKLFGFFWEISMSHDNLNYPMVMDNSYREFFRKILASSYLDKTIIFLMSDHGMRWGKFRKTKQGFLEDRLPFVFALMPTSFRKNFSEAYKNLKLNVRRLTTPYDVHATLSDLINLDNIKNAKIISRTKESYSSKRGISLFLPIPRNRTCKSAAIDDHWCVDFKNAVVDANTTEANEAIRHVMSHLNGLLGDYPQCAKLQLSKVLIVTRLLSDSLKKNNESIELTVAFQTNPGAGEFEATLEREGGPDSSWSLAGSASRLNFYGNQSYCAPTDELKLYCYCIDTMSTSTKPTWTSDEYNTHRNWNI